VSLPKAAALKIITAFSALLFLCIAAGISYDLKLEFSRHNVAWQIAFRGSRVWLDNELQRQRDVEQRIRRIDALDRIIFSSLTLPSDSRTAMEERNRLWAMRNQTIPPQRFSVSVALLLALSAVLPVMVLLHTLWRAGCTIRLQRASRQAVSIGRLSFRSCSIALSAVVCLVITALWVRSLLSIDQLTHHARDLTNLHARVVRLWSAGGRLGLYFRSRVYVSKRYFQYEDPANLSGTSEVIPL